jgi:AcrR family transcriptional regulator
MTKTRTKRGPYARSLKRRQSIAEAVLEIVDELGYEGVTTALVAERSGSNEATVLYHFPTKDHLLLAALARLDDIAAAESGFGPDADVENREIDPGALDKLLNSVDFPLIINAGPRDRLAAFVRGLAMTPGHPAAAYFAERDARAVSIFTRILEARQRAGLVHPALDPADVATQFIALWQGLGALSGVDSTIDANRLLDRGLRMLTGEDIMEAQRRMLELP